jgi:hypothetical protein
VDTKGLQGQWRQYRLHTQVDNTKEKSGKRGRRAEEREHFSHTAMEKKGE